MLFALLLQFCLLTVNPRRVCLCLIRPSAIRSKMKTVFCILALILASAVVVDAKKATASHILVKDEAKCNELKKEIEGGADFAALAKEHSTCPSGKSGGSLGEFGPGQMVAEFDKVVFSAPINEVQGPVKTQFGYHLILITSRTD